MTLKLLALAMLLPLAGCSLTAAPLVDVKQAQDLTDPDTDGVVNAREKCPETLLGSLVDNYGCPNTMTGQGFEELHVLFEHDKSVVRPEYLPSIEKTAQFLMDNPDQSLVIEGHASSPGSDAYNIALTQRRNAAVKKVLVEQYGVPADKIETVAYGERTPAIGREDDQAYAVNRRVVGMLKNATQGVEKKWNVYSVEQTF